MAEGFAIHTFPGEGASLAPFVAPMAEEMLAMRVEELCAQMDAMHDENYRLEKENRQLRNQLFDMQMKLAQAYETIRRMSEQEKVAKTPVIDLTPLHTTQGKELVKKLQQGGLLDEELQPIGLSGAQKGLLANFIAGQLGIADLWQFFASLWQTTSGALRSAYNRSLEQKNTSEFLDRLKEVYNTM